MGEMTCPFCGDTVGHLSVHKTGKCPSCGASITYCGSCQVEIPMGGSPEAQSP